MSESADVTPLVSQVELLQRAVAAIQATQSSRYWVISVPAATQPTVTGFDRLEDAAALLASHRGTTGTFAFVFFGEQCSVEKGPVWYLRQGELRAPILLPEDAVTTVTDGSMAEWRPDIIAEAAAVETPAASVEPDPEDESSDPRDVDTFTPQIDD